MGQVSAIEWTDATWNPVRGCTRVSEGCRNCYAERFAARNLPGLLSPTTNLPFAIMRDSGPRWTGNVELIPSMLGLPLRWKKPRRIFVNSMSDLFHENLSDGDILAVFQTMGKCPRHTFQILTKRADRLFRFLHERRWRNLGHSPAMGGDHHVALLPGSMGHEADVDFLPNVWLGVSVEDRANLKRIDFLSQTPAALRFLSLEPLLEDLSGIGGYLRGIDWAIIGGESGPSARPFNTEWARSIVQQCKESGTACFVKQLGAHVIQNGERRIKKDKKGGDMHEWPHDVRVREMPDGAR